MWALFRSRPAFAPVALLALGGCAETPGSRPQLLVVVDTDVPVVGQLVDHPQWSVDAAVDSVRVDVLTPSNQLIDLRDFIVPDAFDWPVSFGITATGSERTVRLRIRAFRATRATLERLDGYEAPNPLPEAAIHRLVEVDLPTEGVRRVRVVLSGDCYGRLPALGTPPSTCVSKAEREAPPTAGIEAIGDGELAPTAAGSWEVSQGKPCAASEHPERVCIHGGFTLMGDEAFAGFGGGGIETVPLRPVIVSPFWMDRTEYTVGRLRPLVEAGAVEAPQGGQFCTWTAAPGTREAHPANCISVATAAGACAADDGMLPTEAQWEHAARGRQGRSFPWGEESATCCGAVLARYDVGGGLIQCGEYPAGTAEVGTHPLGADCDGTGDLSRDGVADMAGNVSELLRDRLVPYSEDCWKRPGPFENPECDVPPTAGWASRGSNFEGGLASAHVALRTGYSPLASQGFRCVYEDLP